jgi:ABC-type dipeptide/oligopeptide/nickel transport system ATPase component
MHSDPLIEIKDLRIGFPSSDKGWRNAVDGVTLTVGAGEKVGLVGESGSGKSLTALACLGLVPEPGRVTGGAVSIAGTDLSTLSDAELERLRGSEIGLIMQEAMEALNPVYTAGFQVADTVAVHHEIGRKEVLSGALSLLSDAALEQPEDVARAYPHELSGGQAQRVMLALALAGKPRVLIADEPTSALDLLTQAQVIALLGRLVVQKAMSLLLISHDLEVVQGLVDRVAVMKAGHIVEEGPTTEIFSSPRHAYTKMLLESAPGRRGRARSSATGKKDSHVDG